MPKPIPPPPPQPTEEETKNAIVWLRNIAIFALLFFSANAQFYHPQAFFVEYGRESAQEWTTEKIRRTNFEDLRSHRDGKIIWLVGSSMLRDAFDETYLNEELSQKDSSYRVFKIGMNRGSAGVVFGLFSLLPIEKGDQVLINIHETHFKREWLDFSKLPAYRLMTFYTQTDYWNISEWSLPDKLEQSSAVPWNFYAYHESYTRGATRWLSALTKSEWPEKEGPSYHWTYFTSHAKVKYNRGSKNKDYFGRDDLDFSPQQFNIEGIHYIKNALPADVDFHLLYLPCSETYRAEVIHEFHEVQFKNWARSQENMIYFPQAPNDAYYDIKHANQLGRKLYSEQLLKWIHSPFSGIHPKLTTVRPSDRRDL